MNTCKRGHPMTPENTSQQLRGDGSSFVRCIRCHKANAAAYRATYTPEKRDAERKRKRVSRRHCERVSA